MRMVERGDGTGFTLEALAELGFGSLQGDDAIQARVAGLPHLAHAALADGGEDLVRTQAFTGRQRHWVISLLLGDGPVDGGVLTNRRYH